MKKLFLILLLLVTDVSNASGTFTHIVKHSHHKSVKAYEKNPYVEDEVWEKLTPYFLPIDHPIRYALDRIFSEKRLILSSETLRQAGFATPEPRKYSHTIISKHPDLKGYLIKAFSDEQLGITEWKKFLTRIQGAKSIQNSIDKYNFGKYFKVPQKWIYPLPVHPSPPDDPKYQRKNFILVVEDMHVYKREKNRNKYRYCMNTKLLDALYIVLRDEQLTDSVHVMNIPFCKDGRIAFIDTEWHHSGIPPYRIMRRNLSITMRNHWDKLIRRNGPKDRNLDVQSKHFLPLK